MARLEAVVFCIIGLLEDVRCKFEKNLEDCRTVKGANAAWWMNAHINGSPRTPCIRPAHDAGVYQASKLLSTFELTFIL